MRLLQGDPLHVWVYLERAPHELYDQISPSCHG